MSKTIEILRSITDMWLGPGAVHDGDLMRQTETEWSRKLSLAIEVELGVAVSANEIESAGSLLKISYLIDSRLVTDSTKRSLVDFYATLEQCVREELSHDINYHWYAVWQRDLLNDTDSLEDVEIVLRMEETFGFSISDRDAQQMQTVGQTVRYLWQRSCEQNFTLRQRGEGVCQSAFIFYELRRLLMIRGGVPRSAVRLDARLGDLLPSWYRHFWKQVQSAFKADLRRHDLLTFHLAVEKRTTIKDLVALLSSSKPKH